MGDKLGKTPRGNTGRLFLGDQKTKKRLLGGGPSSQKKEIIGTNNIYDFIT